jgi:hypothetical protein
MPQARRKSEADKDGVELNHRAAPCQLVFSARQRDWIASTVALSHYGWEGAGVKPSWGGCLGKVCINRPQLCLRESRWAATI